MSGHARVAATLFASGRVIASNSHKRFRLLFVMLISLDEAKKRMTAAQYRRRKRIRDRNKRSRSYYVTSDGRRVRITAKRRRAQRMQARRLRRMARMSSVKRKIARTKRIRKAIYRQFEGQAHGIGFLYSLVEMVRVTGRPDVGAALLEATAPQDTSSLIGYYMQDVTDKVDKDSQLSKAIVDSIVLDEETFGLVFEKSPSLSASSLLHKLSSFGKPLLVTQPGDRLSDSTVSEMFFIAITAPADALRAAGETDIGDDNDDRDLSASVTNESEAISALCSDPVFRESCMG